MLIAVIIAECWKNTHNLLKSLLQLIPEKKQCDGLGWKLSLPETLVVQFNVMWYQYIHP